MSNRRAWGCLLLAVMLCSAGSSKAGDRPGDEPEQDRANHTAAGPFDEWPAGGRRGGWSVDAQADPGDVTSVNTEIDRYGSGFPGYGWRGNGWWPPVYGYRERSWREAPTWRHGGRRAYGVRPYWYDRYGPPFGDRWYRDPRRERWSDGAWERRWRSRPYFAPRREDGPRWAPYPGPRNSFRADWSDRRW